MVCRHAKQAELRAQATVEHLAATVVELALRLKEQQFRAVVGREVGLGRCRTVKTDAVVELHSGESGQHQHIRLALFLKCARLLARLEQFHAHRIHIALTGHAVAHETANGGEGYAKVVLEQAVVADFLVDEQHSEKQLVGALAYGVQVYVQLSHAGLTLQPRGVSLRTYRTSVIQRLRHLQSRSVDGIACCASDGSRLRRHIHNVCEGGSSGSDFYLRQPALHGVA